jgi:hypothetical protein
MQTHNSTLVRLGDDLLPIRHKKPYKLNITIDENATYTVSPNRDRYYYDDVITITVKPNVGYEGVVWSHSNTKNWSGIGNSRVFEIKGDASVDIITTVKLSMSISQYDIDWTFDKPIVSGDYTVWDSMNPDHLYEDVVNHNGKFWRANQNTSDEPSEMSDSWDEVYLYGQFVNGDYWVVGPITIIGIQPQSVLASAEERQINRSGYLWWSGEFWAITAEEGIIPDADTEYGRHWRNYNIDFEDGEFVAWYLSNGQWVQSTYRNMTVSARHSMKNGQGQEIDVFWADGTSWGSTGWIRGVYTPSGDVLNDKPVYSRQYTVINGSMVNPVPGMSHGFDGSEGSFLFDLNDGALLPLTITPDESTPIKSLVSMKSKLVYDSSKASAPRLSDGAVLTVVLDPPAGDTFRPPYIGNTKPSALTLDDIVWENLPDLSPVEGMPSLSDSEQAFERPWFFTQPEYPSSTVMPDNNMPTYGREHARTGNIAALLLCFRYDANDSVNREIKKPLLVNFLQCGIDTYGHQYYSLHDTYVPLLWANNGGIFSGRLLPVVFAAKLFDDIGMIEVLSKSGAYRYTTGYPNNSKPDDYLHFGESDQTFYITAEAVELSTGVSDSRETENIPYTEEHIGTPEWAVRWSTQPSRTNYYWGAYYRGVVGSTIVGTALAIHMINAKAITNNDALFDYADRYLQVCKDNDPTFSGPAFVGTNGIDVSSNFRLVWNTWNTYRNSCGIVWSET